MDEQDDEIVPKEARILLKNWRCLYRFWWFSHYLIGLIGVVAAAVVAVSSADIASKTVPTAAEIQANPSEARKEAEGILAVIKRNAWISGLLAAVATSLVTFLGPIQKAERYFVSFHMLDQACFELRRDLICERDFSETMNDARKLLYSNDVARSINRNDESHRS